MNRCDWGPFHPRGTEADAAPAMDSEPAPHARLRFEPGFGARVTRFAAHEAAARRTPREDFASSASRAGEGSGEFAGRRRYRAGDALRAFDWEALARGAGEWVRLRSRDAAERWNVLLDSSASMAVGDPPKLQLAGELCLAICAVGLEWGCQVDLASRRGICSLRSKRDLPRALAELDGLEAEGSAGFADWLAHPGLARAQRWIAVGDLFDVEPAIVSGCVARRVRLDAFAVLAAHELAPSAVAAQTGVEWRDPESGAAWAVSLGDASVAAYAAALADHLQHWRAGLARARGELVVARAGDPFEPHLRRWITGARS